MLKKKQGIYKKKVNHIKAIHNNSQQSVDTSLGLLIH